MVNPTMVTLSQLAPLIVQQYERYLPTAFDESMTLLQKMNMIIKQLETIGGNNNTMIENWNDLIEWVETGSISESVTTKLNEWLADGTLNSLTLGRFLPVGENAIKTIDSLYVPNDANIFGYKNDGTYVNIGTVQDNNIVQYGDYNADIMWLEAFNYHSIRAQNSPSFQKIDANKLPIEAGRTIKHQGNSSYHLRVVGVGEHILTKDSPTDLHTLTNVLHVFPPTAYNNFAYIIPREGMYGFNLQLKIKNIPLAKGVIRVSVSILSEGVSSIVEFADLAYDPATYGTPFLNTKFDWKFKKDDQVTVKVEALTENVTIGEGTRLQIYVLGDTIQI
jgi:hypothetical protein